jgi:two-component system, cell cycle sensor histidine kinase and response regulator CckA
VGKGTTFRLYFPAVGRGAGSLENSEPTQDSVPRGSETVLVVEDDDRVRECSVEFLSSIGYNVLGAANGEEALSLATQHQGKIDLMISDVVMPHISGAKLAETLAGSQPGMKVLFVSGHTETLVRRKGIEVDAQFLQKPYLLSLLATQLRKTLEPAPQAHSAVAAGAG